MTEVIVGELETTRTLVVWCADWPVTALGRPTDRAVAVVRANRVVAVSRVAKAAGIVVGLRRREAQRRCPGVEIRERDLDREARAFEPVVAALDDICPRIEITRPGCALFPTRGPSRYFGGDERLVETVVRAVRGALDDPRGVGVGLADGAFAATLGARRSAGRPSPAASELPTVIVPVSRTAAFLAPFPISVLGRGDDDPSLAGTNTQRVELVEVLARLGIDRLGRLAALSPADVNARFGPVGMAAHRMASGLDLRPPILARPSPDLDVIVELDPPLERVDQAAFVAKSMADDLSGRLGGRGLAAVTVLISAEMAGGRVVERRWRHDGALSSAAVAQRVRWQLDGWLTDRRRRDDDLGSDRSSGAIVRLTLRPDDVVPDAGRQEGFWGGDSARASRAAQGLSRVQGLLGSDAVRVAEWRGGRAPGEQYRLVALDTVDLDAPVLPGPEPWPGRLPDPPPALVWNAPRPAGVFDGLGGGVTVDGRGAASANPTTVVIDGGAPHAVTGWGGPWVTDERWWDPVAHRRRARLQIRLDDGSVHLLTLEAGHWRVEATWD